MTQVRQNATVRFLQSNRCGNFSAAQHRRILIRTILGLVLAFPTIAAAADIEISGVCPGPVDFVITGAEPGAQVAILTANAPGGALTPGGPCPGAPLPIGPAGLAFRTAVPADASGAVSIRPSIPAPACGLYVSVLDLTSCEASEPMMIPAIDGGGGGADLYAANGSNGTSGIWAIDLTAGTAVRVSDPRAPITGMANDGTGNIYVIEGGGLSAVSNPNAGRVSLLNPTSGELTPVAMLDQNETSLAFADGLLYAADENTQYASIDPASGTVTVLPGVPDGSGYGFAMAWDGGTMWRVNATELLTVDAVGNTTAVAPVSGLAGARSGGAVFYDGQLWIITDDGRGGSGLYSVDPVTGATTYSGISMPDPDIDAITSAR